jgi:type IV pilus assembly protein PilC
LMLIMWIVVFVVVIKLWKNTNNGRYLFDKMMLKLPILWQVTQKIILSKFSRIFSGLIGSWVSIVESLKITAEALWNEVYRQRILFLAESVKSWVKIWESIEWDPMFPEMMIQMIRVWEETAKLDKTIIKVADFYDEQVDNIIWSINKLLEPVIIIVLAVIVWFIAVAIMQPIMNLSDTISEE